MKIILHLNFGLILNISFCDSTQNNVSLPSYAVANNVNQKVD